MHDVERGGLAEAHIAPPVPKILIVDDTPANLTVFEAILTPLGCQLCMATSGPDALRLLLLDDFALILMDVQMPGMSGIEAAEIIKRSEQHRHIPILFVTASCRDQAFILRGYETGAVDYILKPFDAEILRSKVSVLVELFCQKEIIRRQAEILRRHEREAMERRCELRFRALIDAMPLCVWAARAGGRFCYANKAWVAYAGAASGRPVEVTLLEALHPEDRARVYALWRSAVRSRRPIEVQARLRRRSDGVYRWHLARAVPEEEGGSLTGWIVTATDIDEQKRAEEAEHAARKAAESANSLAMQDEFLSTVSHELRTPMTAIIGWVDLLRESKLRGAAAEGALAAIARNAEKEMRVVRELLDVSRIVTGRLQVDFEPIDPASVVDEVLDDLGHVASAKGLKLERDVDARGGLLVGDGQRLRQVVHQLVGNAIKFTPKGGRVSVVFARLGARFVLSVIDTGEGMRPELLPRVFDCFTQADPSSRRRHGGLGLGLAMVRRLVELHGGSVCAASEGEGRGATFLVELPARVGARPSVGAGRTLAGRRVLVVGEDSDERAQMMEVLEKRGAAVMPVISPEEALSVAAHWRPDVIVSDWGTPGAPGPTLLREVKAREGERASPPTVAVIRAARAERVREAIAAGAEGTISRPIHPEHLVAAVAGFAEP